MTQNKKYIIIIIIILFIVKSLNATIKDSSDSEKIMQDFNSAINNTVSNNKIMHDNKKNNITTPALPIIKPEKNTINKQKITSNLIDIEKKNTSNNSEQIINNNQNIKKSIKIPSNNLKNDLSSETKIKNTNTFANDPSKINIIKNLKDTTKQIPNKKLLQPSKLKHNIINKKMNYTNNDQLINPRMPITRVDYFNKYIEFIPQEIVDIQNNYRNLNNTDKKLANIRLKNLKNKLANNKVRAEIHLKQIESIENQKKLEELPKQIQQLIMTTNDKYKLLNDETKKIITQFIITKNKTLIENNKNAQNYITENKLILQINKQYEANITTIEQTN